MMLVPRHNSIISKGTKLHYLDWGNSDRVLVCLHGASGNALHWQSLAEYLTPSFRVIALDQRGCGESDAPETGYDAFTLAIDLNDVIDELDLSNFYLLGASMGSRICAVYSSKHSNVILKLILCELSFEMPESSQQRMINGHLKRPRAFGSFDEVFAFSKSIPSRARWDAERHKKVMLQDVFERSDGRWEWRYNLHAALEGLRLAREDLWGCVRDICCPTLLLRGKNSDVLLKDTALKIASSMKNCKFIEIENAGHGVPRDNPAEFNRAVSEFLNS
jgi:esterase